MIEQWTEEFETLQRNPPQPDHILVTSDGSPVKLTIDLNEGEPPYIFGRAFVPQIVGAKLGWFAQGANDHQRTGWKCILLPRARGQLIERFGLGRKEVFVKSLRLVKYSTSGSAMLCEISEW